MKKIITIILIFIFMSACSQKQNPTDIVINYLESYQKLDESVLNELEKDIDKKEYLTNEQKKKYKEIMIKQYQNMNYKIKDEEINKNKATVQVVIEVLDYQQVKKNAKDFFLEHQEELTDETLTKENIELNSRYIDYEIEELQKNDNKVKYSFYIDVVKEKDDWKLEYINEDIIKKINGLY